jgi:HEAT repeat protein
MKRFNTDLFLGTHFSGPAELVRMVSAYGLGEIEYATAQKWFQRGRISAEWFPNLLCALEFEHGKAVAVREFFA